PCPCLYHSCCWNMVLGGGRRNFCNLRTMLLLLKRENSSILPQVVFLSFVFSEQFLRELVFRLNTSRLCLNSTLYSIPEGAGFGGCVSTRASAGVEHSA